MIFVLLMPLITALICYSLKSARGVGYVSLAGTVALASAALPVIIPAVSNPVEMVGGMFYMDALSGYIMALVIFLSLASAAYSIEYLEHEMKVGLTGIIGIRRYYALLHLFIFTMLLVTAANNLALMWIAIEATTIVSALLIGLGFSKRSLAIEAAWKYIILCTVGIIFALLGIFITYYATISVMGGEGTLNWTTLRAIAPKLNPSTMKLAFIFILLGYGTKAGLAPVHNWLPDAHSEAPSPISALLSGILLNTAFYGIIRFISIVDPSTGSVFTGNLLILFGLLSMGISSVFILVQVNYKRLLAYSSIEHMGIIALGMGIGGTTGVYGALLHIMNHALSKPLMFFVSGKIQANYGSTKIENVQGVLSSMPLLGTLTFIGVLSLTGTPPFNIFLSEFTVLKAIVDKGLWVVAGLFLLFLALVFYGMLSGFGKMLFGGRETTEVADKEKRESSHEISIARTSLSSVLNNGIMVLLASLIIIFGLTVPAFIDSTIRQCIDIMGAK
jgi:hydrogenase-4 component F